MDVVLFPTRFSRINSTCKNRYYGSSIYTGEYYKSQAAAKKIKREMVGGSRIGSIYNSENLTWMSCGIDRPAQVITRPWDGRTGRRKKTKKKQPNVTDAYTYFLGRYVGRTLSNQTKISK